MHGMLVIDKPRGPSSQQVLNRVGKILQTKKLGHSGTLDPFATGVLPVFFGEGTKLIPFIEEDRKIYKASLELGKSTDTLDETGLLIEQREVAALADSQIAEVFDRFLGDQNQTPPLYSAVKYKGVPLYKYARKGQAVVVSPRKITIFSLKLLGRETKILHFETEVSRGTYIRVLASEIAQALGTVGTLKELCRIQSGPFSIEGSLSIDQLDKIKNPLEIQEHIDDNLMLILSKFVKIEIEDFHLITRLLNGQAIPYQQDSPPKKTIVVLAQNEILAVCRFEGGLDPLEGWLKPLRILHIPISNLSVSGAD